MDAKLIKLNQVELWYQAYLKQVAAESYLDQAEGLQRLLGAGNQNLSPDFNTEGLPFYTKLTSQQIADLLGSSPEQAGTQIVNHHANDSTGFSATLMKDKDGNFTLAFRSTEFKQWENGGDAPRDQDGANPSIFTKGFALAQLASAESYYYFLTHAAPGSEPILKAADLAKLTVSGYSLGGHIAQVFTTIHPEIVSATVFNAAGYGRIAGSTLPGLIADLISKYGDLLLDPSKADDPVTKATLINYYVSEKGFEEIAAQLEVELLIASAKLAQAAGGPAPFESLASWEAKAAGSRVASVIYGDARHELAQLMAEATYRLGGQSIFTVGKNTFQDVFGLGKEGKDGNLTSYGNLGNGADSRITSIYGRASNRDVQLVANSQHSSSNRYAVFIEDQPEIELSAERLADYGNTHAITLIGDSLATKGVSIN